MPPEGGETLEQVCTRAREFLQQVVEPAWETTERIMIVAHGALTRSRFLEISE